MRITNSNGVVVLACSLALTLGACTKKKKDSDSGSDPAGGTGGSVGGDAGDEADVGVGLSVAPSGLNLTIFPATADAAALNLAKDGLEPSAEDEQLQKEQLDPEFRKAEEEKRLKGEGDCLPPIFSASGGGMGEEACYEFDQDMLYGGMSPMNSSTIQSYRGTPNGLDADGSHACLVTFARSQVETVQARLDKAMGLVQAMICQARKDDASFALPSTAGEALDLKTALGNVMGDKFGTIGEATITYVGDTAAGHPIFLSKISSTRAIAGSDRTQEVWLRHAKDPTDDSLYSGLLTVAFRGESESQEGGSKRSDALMNILYSQQRNVAGETIQQLELRTGLINEDIADGAVDTDTGLIDFNVSASTASGADQGIYKKEDGSSYAEANQAAHGFTLIKAQMNLTTEAREVAYWQNPGGRWDESARGMVFSLATNDAGQLAGCGLSGASFNESIRMSLADSSVILSPAGFMHPFFNETSSNGCSLTENGAAGSLNSIDGNLYERTCASQVARWLEPSLADSAAASTFATFQQGDYVTRQCFVRADDDVYAIDGITETAGYELVDMNDPPAEKLVSAPSFTVTTPSVGQ